MFIVVASSIVSFKKVLFAEFSAILRDYLGSFIGTLFMSYLLAKKFTFACFSLASTARLIRSKLL